MNIIGRKEELRLLRACASSNKPEFLVVYGRRRVGKTYLIREFFSETFCFFATAHANGDKETQLAVFNKKKRVLGRDSIRSDA